MDPRRRTLLQVHVPSDRHATNDMVERLMGRKPELRFQFIQERARTADSLDV